MALAQVDSRDFGGLLRFWRTHRRYSQLDLANLAEVSTRHLSFLETGRSKPSREMVVHLAEHLDVPLGERDDLLVAAGLAPEYGGRPLDAEEMRSVRSALTRVLDAHQPNPAIVVDRQWGLVDANAAAGVFLADVAPDLLVDANVVRLSLHPDGLAPQVVNFAEYAAHLVWRLRRQVDRTADPVLADLLAESLGYLDGVDLRAHRPSPNQVVLPMQVRFHGRVLDLFSTISVFGAPMDSTVEDLAVEAFYPVDDATAAVLASLG